MTSVLAKLLDIAGFLRFVWRRWSEDRCPMIAGSLTYTTLLALAPTFLVAVSVMSSLPFFDELMTQFKIFLLMNLVPEVAGTIIKVYMVQFAANAARLTTLGVVVVLGLAVWLLIDIDRTLNAIWRVERSRPYWVSILAYVCLLLTGPALIALSVSVTTYAMRLSANLGELAAARPVLIRAVPIALNALTFFIIYRLIPNRHVPWRHALFGATIAGVLFETAKELFRVYVHYQATYNLMYGALAFVPILLVWMYLSWLIVLLGAELTVCAAYWLDGRWKKPVTPAVRFSEGVGVTRALIEADRPSLPFDEIMQRTRLPVEELEETLTQLVASGVLRRAGRNYALTQATRDVLARPPRHEEKRPRFRLAKRGRARSGRSSR